MVLQSTACPPLNFAPSTILLNDRVPTVSASHSHTNHSNKQHSAASRKDPPGAAPFLLPPQVQPAHVWVSRISFSRLASIRGSLEFIRASGALRLHPGRRGIFQTLLKWLKWSAITVGVKRDSRTFRRLRRGAGHFFLDIPLSKIRFFYILIGYTHDFIIHIIIYYYRYHHHLIITLTVWPRNFLYGKTFFVFLFIGLRFLNWKWAFSFLM